MIQLKCEKCGTVINFDDEIAFCKGCDKYINMDSTKPAEGKKNETFNAKNA
jgi:hypothetical protein